MKQTSNYQLNQWEMTDRIRMEDFNGDNEKVDAALKGQAEALAAETAAREAGDTALTDKLGLHLLASTHLTSGQANMTLELPGIDWTQWRFAFLVVELASGSSSCKMTTNSGSTVFSSTPEYCHAFLAPLGRPSAPFSGVVVTSKSSATSVFTSGNTFQTLTQLFLVATTSGSRILSGSKMSLYGMK